MHRTRQIRFLMAGLFLVVCSAAGAATGTHLAESTLYPRLIRLRYAPAPLRNTILAKTSNRLFRSMDEGRTFTYLTSVPTINLEEGSPGAGKDDPDKERCCSTIFELPSRVGEFAAGTLLYSGSFFSGGVPAVEIYVSTDEGAHWRYLSTPMRAGDDHHGLWEPAFSMAADGSLAMFVSDETDRCCSQKLVQMRTRDLRTWSAKQDTVASTAQPQRPGMATVSRLPGGTYFMSYEICGPATHCAVYGRTSRDGWNFGPPAEMGTKIVTETGQSFRHAPGNLFLEDARELVLAGQVLFERDGSVSPQNGTRLFVTASADGTGPWRTIAAPVAVPSAYDNYCPNYSSALLGTANGVLELASDYDTGRTTARRTSRHCPIR